MSDQGQQRATRALPPVLAGTALALAVTAVAGGALAAFLASPLVLLLAALALRASSSDPRRLPSRLVGAGGLSSLFGIALIAAAPAAGPVLTIALGGTLVLLGARLSLQQEPFPEGLGPPERSLALQCAVAADLGVEALWELGGRLRSASDWSRWVAELRALVERHEQRGWIRNPERAHPLPPPLEKPELRLRRLPGLGRFEQLRFASEFEPGDQELREPYLARARNRIAHAYLWRHPDGPRPTLICVHGFGMGRVALDVWRWDVAWLHRQLGLDVVLPILPLHGPRAEFGVSGLGFFDLHPSWTSLALGHSIWDLRRVAGWLREQGAPALGVHGLSLGGNLAALYASLDAGLASVIPMIPAVELSRLWWRQLPRDRRRAAQAAGLTLELLEAAWAPHAPLRHRPRTPFAARLIVAAAADRLVPPEQASALWEHWGRPAIHWFPGSHQCWSGRDALRSCLGAHLSGTLLAEPPPDQTLLSRFRR